MRALGPGSVSSFLKIVLDVAYYFFIFILGLLGVGIVGALLAVSFVPDLFQEVTSRLGIEEQVTPARLVGLAIVIAVYVALYFGALIAIISRLRKVFMTLTAGDPFEPQNISRLRVIGFVLAGMEIARYVLRASLMAIAPELEWEIDGFNITVWFSVLVVFVLAEVFREGARLRREAELTI